MIPVTSATTTPVTPYAYPASPTLCAAIDRVILAEVMTCPTCCREWGRYRLVRDCPDCGATRDEDWWEWVKRNAGGEAGRG